MTTVASGQIWIHNESRSQWRVVSLDGDGLIGLSGPGPCRSMAYVSVDDIETQYSLLEDDEDDP